MHLVKQAEPPVYRIRKSVAGSSKRGGDFATVVEVAPDRHAFIVGDVAGHGAAAGDGATALCAYVRYVIALRTPLADTLRGVSRFFSRRVMSDTMPFASLFVAIADRHERTITFVSAGHEPALLFGGKDASAHVHLEPTGPLLGVEPDPTYTEAVIPLFQESLLVVVTDGITDARRRVNGDLAFFGTSGVARAVRYAARDRRDAAQEVYTAAVLHAGGSLSDGACVMVSPLSFAAL